MTQIQRLYDKKLLDSDLQDSRIHFSDIYRQIDEYEELFKNTILYKQMIYEKQPKHYLQNKTKKTTGNIQESVREQIERLNEIYADNVYFMNVEKDVLEKDSNKYTYNVFKISIIEYQCINLMDDFIYESDSFYSGRMKPITYSNLSPELKLALYEKIDTMLKLKELYVEHDEQNDFTYHNNFFQLLRDCVYEYFIELYTTIDPVNKKLYKLIEELEPASRSSAFTNLETVLEYNLEKHPDIVEKIIDILIKKNWELSMNVLNVSLLEQIVNHKS